MKSFILKIRRIIHILISKDEVIAKYKHGINFHNNGHIDSLNPQFIEIGDNFVSAPGSIITAHDASTFLFSKKYRIEKIKIGNNVFLGANSVVLPGVNIGDNVIIGAGAVVSKDIPSNSVYAGNPAKYICTVNEYIDKCETKNILYEVPNDFIREFESGKIINQNLIKEFQRMSFVRYSKKIEDAEK